MRIVDERNGSPFGRAPTVVGERAKAARANNFRPYGIDGMLVADGGRGDPSPTR